MVAAGSRAGPYLFVYGTLRREARTTMARRLEERASYVGPATMHGKLYDLGRYPAMVAGGHKLVKGELWRVPAPGKMFALLDAYESPEFHRVQRRVHLNSGSARVAWVYLYRLRPPEKARIRSGDYFAR